MMLIASEWSALGWPLSASPVLPAPQTSHNVAVQLVELPVGIPRPEIVPQASKHGRQFRNKLLHIFPLCRLLVNARIQVLADAFGSAFHGLGGDLKPGQQFNLAATVIEGSFRSHRRQHSPNPGRQIFVFNVQFDVEGDLAFATV